MDLEKNIRPKNVHIKHVISLIRVLHSEKLVDKENFKVNKFDFANNEHNFSIETRIFEIQKREENWEILAEDKSRNDSFFKIGKIPCKFLSTKEIEFLIDYLTALIEQKEIISSIEDIIG